MRTPRRDGFTLIEMVLATALCAVLLLALWMLMSTYGDLFDKGQEQVERAQLCRTLLEQFAEDLRTAIQDPLPATENEAGGEAQRRRFGLFGTSRELRFDVLQPALIQGNATPVGQADTHWGEPQAARVPELRTVHYSFVAPTIGEDLASMPSSGLVRTELDFETPVELEEDSPVTDIVNLASGLSDVSDSGAADGIDGPTQSSPLFDDARLVVPEVAALAFRYFDGRNWFDSWNSLERKALPAAVEVQLQLVALPSRARRSQADPRADAAPEATEPAARGDLDDELASAAPSASTSTARAYRLVVDLPGSPRYRPPPVETQALARPTVRIPSRRAPAPRATAPPTPAPLPEDWIRTRKQ